MNREPETRSLPTLVPDLIAQRQTGGNWTVRQMSDALAGALSRHPDETIGLPLRQMFRKVSPPLWDLADEIVAKDRSLSDIPVRLDSAESDLLLEAVPGGLGDDYVNPLVYFRFYRKSPGGLQEGVPSQRFGLVGSSPGMAEVFRKIALYAESDAAVLVTGETGTGKELVARAIHEQSDRSQGAFVAVNCSAISNELLESELFGHEKGAFTGAHRTHRGRFERADGGTIFLDEIGDMPAATQVKLLRVLETGQIERVGAETSIDVDVRLVCATNVPLEEAVGRGDFRSDLYHRLAVLRVHLPPLRQRMDDLSLLIDHFIQVFNRKYGKQIKRLTPEAVTLLQSYLWPGNIRELRNVLERVFVETDSDVIGARAFAEWVRERQDFSPGDWSMATDVRPSTPPLLAGYEPIEETNRPSPSVAPKTIRKTTRPANLSVEAIRSAYRQAGGNLAEAARRLGVHRATLYRYLEKHRITRDDLD